MSSVKRFVDSVIIITGSSAGIGRQTALEFAREGASVVIHGQCRERLEETEKLLNQEGIGPKRILSIIGQLEREEVPKQILEQTLDKFGKIDVLVNNAAAGCKPGITFKAGSDANSLANLDYLFAVNLRSVVQLLEGALPYLEATKGNVVNISTSGALRPLRSAAFYCALKSALNTLTESYAQIWGPKGVRINNVSPGPIKTLIFERNGICGTKKEQHKKWVESATLMGRYGNVDEVAAVIKFLASKEASFVCGANWLVDAGMAIKAIPVDISGEIIGEISGEIIWKN
uniref:Uncharacterized protein n=1 Tax=Meloidogyne incognita TaxID=6306 RepID=A0A914M219_MELIC